MHIVWFGRRGIVHKPAYVKVIFFGSQFFLAYQSAVFGNLLLAAIDEGDFFNIFGPQFVLVLPFLVFTVGIDEKHLVAQVSIFFINHNHACRNTCAIKQSRRQTNYRFQITTAYEPLPELPFLATPEQHTVRHYHRHTSGIVDACHHVLHKHKIGFVFYRHPEVEAFFKLHAVFGVVLRKRRIGNNDIKGFYFSIGFNMQWVHQCIAIQYFAVVNSMKQHIHLTQTPNSSAFLLSVKRDVSGRTITAFYIVFTFNEQTATAYSRVIYFRIFSRLKNIHQ